MIGDRGLRTKGPVRDRLCRHCSPAAVLLALLSIGCCGCSEPQVGTSPRAVQGVNGDSDVRTTDSGAAPDAQPSTRIPQPPTGFGPAKVSILPLTEFTESAGGGPGRKLRVYVVLLDAFGSQIKAPGTWRFELYEYVPRSAERKGQRVAISPRDIDLTRPVENNGYWRDFLRAYEFDVDMQADPKRPYVLEATCVCPDGKRLSGEYLLRSG